MAYAINTNIPGLFAHNYGVINQRRLDDSLRQISSGLRISIAADDPSGLSIADNLRNQATSLGQAVRNSNDSIGILQTADGAMAAQVKIADTIRVKAVQAAQDGQSTVSRAALQGDIVKLMQELDQIATTTSFNGINLLSGGFTNKEFQVGAYTNEVVTASINSTLSTDIGYVRYETTKTISSSGNTALVFSNTNGSTLSMQPVALSFSAGTGLGKLAATINAASSETGVRATYSVMTTGSAAVGGGNYKNITINGVGIGDVLNVQTADANGSLVNAINATTLATGVYASIDIMGRLNLTSMDGRGIQMQVGSAAAGFNSPAMLGVKMSSASATSLNNVNMGRLTLMKLDSSDIEISVPTNDPLYATINSSAANATFNLSSIANEYSAGAMLASGAFANAAQSGAASTWSTPGVTTMTGAMMAINIAQSAQEQLDFIRAGIGSAVNQITAALSNISTTAVNVSAAESQIRDTDFALASSNFTKYNILAQAGSFVMAQSNQVQQSVLKLLQ